MKRMTLIISEVFNRKGSRKIKKAIEEEFDWGGGFDLEEVGLLRTKLRYLPVIMWTAMTGCFGHSAKAIVEWKNLRHPIFEDPLYKPIREGTNWQKEDERTYNWLISRLPVNVKVVRCIHGDKHVAWPMRVFDIKEVMDEVHFLTIKPFLNVDDEYDMQIIEKFGKFIDITMIRDGKIVKIGGAEGINMTAQSFGELLNHNIDVYKKYGMDFWFTIYYS